jgi:hypothetical protein
MVFASDKVHQREHIAAGRPAQGHDGQSHGVRTVSVYSIITTAIIIIGCDCYYSAQSELARRQTLLENLQKQMVMTCLVLYVTILKLTRSWWITERCASRSR